MSPDQGPHSKDKRAPLPDSLRRQLEAFRGRLWFIKVAEALLAGLFGLLFSYLVVFGLDRIWNTPPTVRLVILLGGTSLFTLFAPYWIHRWVFRHRREAQLARLIARKFPRLGDRMLGVVELQDQRESKEALSPELRAAAMKAVAKQAEGRNLKAALPAPRHIRWALMVLTTAAIIAAALWKVPKPSQNAFERWLRPFSDVQRYTFTKISDFKETIIVPMDEPFSVTVSLSELSDQRPTSGVARFGIQEPVSAQLQDDKKSYTFDFPGQSEPGRVLISIGDARPVVEVIPQTRPAIKSVRATIVYPEYLQLQDKTKELRVGTLSGDVVVGSQVSLEATTLEGRELKTGMLTIKELPKTTERDLFDSDLETLGDSEEIGEATDNSDSNAPLAADPLLDGEKEDQPAPPRILPLRVAGSQMISPRISLQSQPLELQMNWEDVNGLEDAGGHRIRVEPLEDQKPIAYIQDIERQTVILEEETVSFEIIAEDDYGSKQIGYEWTGEFTKPTDETPSRGSHVLELGAPNQRRLSGVVHFSPKTRNIPAQKLQVRAFVEDYFPGRGRVYSEPITLHILTKDEQAQLLKDQFDRVIGELEDAARREQNNFDENRRIEQDGAEKLQEEANKERLEQQEMNEAENIEKMSELSERMEELLGEALKNGEVEAETMQKMAETMQKMQELSKEDMPKVEQQLQEAQDPSSTPEQSEKDLQEAIEEQEKVLEKMRETIEGANEANQDFEASTFVNRLRRAASEEDGIANTLIASIDDKGNTTIAGTPYDELDPVDQRVLGELSMQQRRTASDVHWIHEDLGHFYARTEKEEHKQIMVEMRESNIDSHLEAVREKIVTNRTFMALSSAKKWADQLKAWADILDPPEDPSGAGGGGGGEGQEPSLDDNDFEFMLKVMAMIQTEQDIRARTRALEQLRRTLHLQDLSE
ncbi:MAG: hypothetical protein P8M65_10420 [Roseibacillus sp.]|nr:hypothetical protein [Roseibacillus sp.]